MDTVEIVIIAVVAFFGLLALGGFLFSRRRARANEPHFKAQLEIANQDLAAAHAADKGWEPTRLHEAARSAFAQEHGGRVAELELVQVVDPPGTDQDKAVFRVVDEHGEHTLTMGRSGDDWRFEGVS